MKIKTIFITALYIILFSLPLVPVEQAIVANPIEGFPDAPLPAPIYLVEMTSLYTIFNPFLLGVNHTLKLYSWIVIGLLLTLPLLIFKIVAFLKNKNSYTTYYFSKNYIYDTSNGTQRVIHLAWLPIADSGGLTYEKLDFGKPEKTKNFPPAETTYETKTSSHQGEMTYRFYILKDWLWAQVTNEKGEASGFRFYHLTPQDTFSYNHTEAQIDALEKILVLMKIHSKWKKQESELKEYQINAIRWAKNPD